MSTSCASSLHSTHGHHRANDYRAKSLSSTPDSMDVNWRSTYSTASIDDQQEQGDDQKHYSNRSNRNANETILHKL